LDVACGTAEHLRHLAPRFQVEGIDLNPTFIELARRKLPAGRFEVADMRDFERGRTFDALTCLFSSIGYLLEDREVVSALECFRRHLAPGGVLVIEPWFEPRAWVPGQVSVHTAEDGDLKVCRMVETAVEGDAYSLFVAHYLVSEAGRVRHFVETHRMRLLSRGQLTRLFEQTGFRPEFLEATPGGRGLHVARAPV
jgi:SAM-dependent methyltransferase